MGLLFEGCSIRCRYGSQILKYRQSIYFVVNQSLNEALGGSICFLGSLEELLPRSVPSVKEPSGPIIVPTYLAYLTIFISRNSSQFVDTQRPETGRSSTTGRTEQPTQNHQHKHTERVEESFGRHGFLG